MFGGFRIGRVFGITIEIDWSWLFIFFLMTWNLGLGFARWHPEWGTAVQWILAFCASLLFFASVLLHELSHSLVAKARGLPVRRITLFMLGGISNLEREPESPSTEFLMAVVGPLTSIALGLACLVGVSATAGNIALLDRTTELIARLGPMPTLLLWLGSVNVFVGLFNLVPGFPLDGGRILRAAVWASTKDLRCATRWASGFGQAVGWVLIVAGVSMLFGVRLPVFGTGVGGIWLAFIGWFLTHAASASYRQLVIRDLLEDVPVSRLMRRHVPAIAPDLPVSRLVYDWIIGTDERAFPVMKDGVFLGIVCLEDVRRVPRDVWDRTVVADIMTRAEQLTALRPGDDARDALDAIQGRNVGQVPIVDHGQLVGVIRRGDIVRWLAVQGEWNVARPER